MPLCPAACFSAAWTSIASRDYAASMMGAAGAQPVHPDPLTASPSIFVRVDILTLILMRFGRFPTGADTLHGVSAVEDAHRCTHPLARIGAVCGIPSMYVVHRRCSGGMHAAEVVVLLLSSSGRRRMPPGRGGRGTELGVCWREDWGDMRSGHGGIATCGGMLA